MPAGGSRRVVIEADGGSRGNPGPAAYGALLRDADTGEIIAERAETIGIATNNVAEYQGLIAGLELLAEHAPGADVEVRMDSKLVVEQMAGRWKVKHPDMKPLAIAAQRLAPFGVEWSWVPRAENRAADAILNDALDAAAGKSPQRSRVARTGGGVEPGTEPASAITKNPLAGWRDSVMDPPTTIILLRHGVTDSTVAKLFCGTGGSDPSLNAEGRAQAERAAAYLERRGGVDAIVSSPLRRTQQTAAVVADRLGLEVATEDAVREASFGEWDGLSFAQVKEQAPDALDAWLGDTGVAPPGGEPYDAVHTRVRAARDRLIDTYRGRTVVVVSHVTPIKMFVRLALDARMDVIHKLELAPASLTTLRWWPDGVSTVRSYSYVPE